MLSWSAQKKLVYISVTLFIFALIVGIPVYFKFIKKPPTCFDGILNQDEREVDCGGVCLKLCKNEAIDPAILFERYFNVISGIYNGVALIENRNVGLYALRVPYVMKLYDNQNVLLAERVGETFLTGAKTFPIIEYAIDTKERKVSKITFSFLGEIDWKRGAFKDPDVEVINKKLFDDKGLPRLSAVLRNNEIYRIGKTPVVALLYGEGGNLIASSHTLVDEIAGQGETPVVFTWNEAFKDTPTKIDIVPRLIPRELTK